MIRSLTAPLVLALAAATAAGAQSVKPSEQQTKTLNLSAYAELLRSDVRVQKVAIITEVMGFTEAEDAAFWPIYRDYDAEMSKLGDERVALIAEYARNYEEMSDEVAERLARRALDLEARRQAVKAKSYERVRAALKPRTALRFLQVEHQLLLLLDLQISAALPIADK
jgi:CHAT domain-containing protein